MPDLNLPHLSLPLVAALALQGLAARKIRRNFGGWSRMCSIAARYDTHCLHSKLTSLFRSEACLTVLEDLM